LGFVLRLRQIVLPKNNLFGVQPLTCHDTRWDFAKQKQTALVLYRFSEYFRLIPGLG
jgi:hypothetical protein